MYQIRANIQLSDKNRQQKISGNSYRPLLYFSDSIIRSGLIVLENYDYLEMDKSYENILLKIYFYKDLDCSKEFFIGRKFELREGSLSIGDGIITEIIGDYLK